mmetsp:Transcript_34849/g.84682  ORF Transcript_34849/g.84682 Transcript_34849/m.84682 type:complete len:610 (+) Transcript_34849:34-1863(+)
MHKAFKGSPRRLATPSGCLVPKNLACVNDWHRHLAHQSSQPTGATTGTLLPKVQHEMSSRLGRRCSPSLAGGALPFAQGARCMRPAMAARALPSPDARERSQSKWGASPILPPPPPPVSPSRWDAPAHLLPLSQQACVHAARSRDGGRLRGDGGGEHRLLPQQLARGVLDEPRAEPRLLILLPLPRRLDVLVRQHHRPHLELPLVQPAAQREEVQHVVAEAADGALLDGDEDVVLLGELADQLGVERLHPPRVRHRHAHLAVRLLQRARGGDGAGEARAEAEDRHARLGARARLPDHPPLAHRQHRALLGHLLQLVAEEVVELLEAERRAARVAQRRRERVDGVDGVHHVHQLHLVRRRADDDVGDAAEVGEVEGAVVRRPVVADEAGAVEDEADGELLDGAVVDHLVVGALEEGGVDGAEGLEALGRLPRGEGDGVLLGDPHVEGALGEAAAELVDARAAGHRGGDRDDRPVGRGDVDQRVGEDGSVRGRLGGDHLLLPGGHVELGHAVVLVGGELRGRVAVALLRLDVEQHGLVAAAVAHALEDGDEVVEVVAVDGADVVEAQLLEERAAGDEAARVLVDLGVGLLDLLGEELVDRLGGVAEVLEGL